MKQTSDWLTCRYDDECGGIRWSEEEMCLAHLAESDQQQAMAALEPGSDVDLRGTSISEDLCKRLLDALTPAGHTAPLFGSARFDQARFAGDAWFDQATFSGVARFQEAPFNGEAWFGKATFSEDAGFDQATFNGRWEGAFRCEGALRVGGAVVAKAARLDVDARVVDLSRVRFVAPMELVVRRGVLRLEGAAAEATVSVVGPTQAVGGDDRGSHGPGGSGPARATLVSLAGVDAANVVLKDVDLSRCVFTGALNLDQIRLEGDCELRTSPRGWRWGKAVIPVRRWTGRRVLAEEAAWRSGTAARRPALARAGWQIPELPDAPEVPVATLAQLAVLYRQLRKALEDGKNTPGASDFYYGETEARRLNPRTARGERWLLHAYWLLSGYALRTSRALGFLAVTAAITFLLMMAVGLPDTQPSTEISGNVPTSGGPVTLTESTPDPDLTLPWSRRFTATRADLAGLVVVNSVIFRTTDDTYTAPGTWIEIISRIGEPVLLGFGAVAARGRVQR